MKKQFVRPYVKSAPHFDFMAFSNYTGRGLELNVGRPGKGPLKQESTPNVQRALGEQEQCLCPEGNERQMC